VYFVYICWKFAKRLLDRVNTPLDLIAAAEYPDPPKCLLSPKIRRRNCG